jgi:hypothetical protein
MGLAEKRAQKAAEEGWLPARQKELTEISGATIPYEVEWASFDGDAKGIEWLEHNGPQQVSMALRGICHDALGKEAIQGGLKKVVLRNCKDVAAKALSFQGGVLTLHCAWAQSPGGRFNDREIQACLEAGL